MSNNTSSSSGIGFFGVLGIAFIILKIVGTITWSWWWVLAPIWMPLPIILIIIFIVGIIQAFIKG